MGGRWRGGYGDWRASNGFLSRSPRPLVVPDCSVARPRPVKEHRLEDCVKLNVNKETMTIRSVQHWQ